jgi:hypothetical protein
LRSYKYDDFVVHFLLWGRGGNFVQEHRLWESEESQSWQTVGRCSFADIVRDPLSGANRVPLCRLHAHQPTVLQTPATPRLAFLTSTSCQGHGITRDLLSPLGTTLIEF